MGGKEDGLELSLSLGPKKLMQSTSHHHHHHLHRKNHQRIISNWNHHLSQASDINSKISHKDESKMYLRGGFEVDWAPPQLPVEISGVDNENVEASSPNSTVSSGCGKREPSSSRDDNCVIGDAFAGDEVDRGGGGDASAAKKKLRLSKEQSVVLEETFKERSTLNPRQKVALAKQLELRPRQVEVWFQNRRARTKLKQTEVDCEYLRRCCENLAEENRLLQKDVMELRALKLSSPHLYVHVPPPVATCPACEPAVSSPEAATDTCHQHLVGPARPMPVPVQSWTPMQFRPLDAHGPPP